MLRQASNCVLSRDMTALFCSSSPMADTLSQVLLTRQSEFGTLRPASKWEILSQAIRTTSTLLRSLIREDGLFLVRIWSVENRSPIRQLDAKSIVYSVAVFDVESKIAAGTSSGAVLIWDMEAIDTEPVTLSGHGRYVLSVSFSREVDYYER
jgi:WD40 repeat protein